MARQRRRGRRAGQLERSMLHPLQDRMAQASTGREGACVLSVTYEPFPAQTRRSRDELDGDGGGDDSGAMALVEQATHCLAAPRAVVERPVVDVHADETVRQLARHVASVAQGIGQSVLAMRQRVADTLLQQSADLPHGVVPQVTADDVAAQRQWQAGALLPPDAEVGHQAQPLVLEGELSLVNDQARIEVT